MRERGEVARRADRAAARHDRHDVALEQAEQQLDELGPHARVALAQRVGEQQQHPAHDLGGQRLAGADRVRADEVALQLRRVGGAIRTDERSPKPVVTPYTTAPSATSASTVARPRRARARVGRERAAGAAAGHGLELVRASGRSRPPMVRLPGSVRAMSDAPVIRAPRGRELSCRGWLQEAALRMLMNNLDPEVAEDPANLVVYGGTGRAARSWEAFHAIVATLRRLADDETLLVQSGKPVGVFRTHAMAPRVLIANSLLVPDWADWETFRRLEAEGLTMYGQMTAGSWIYIGTQGIVQGTYETFAAVARKRFDGTLRGRLVLTAGCGGMGGAQPLAVTMLDGVCLVVDVDAHRLERRVETRYLDLVAPDLDSALREVEEARAAGDGRSIGIVGNAAEVFEELLGAASSPTSSPTRRAPTTRSAATCPTGSRWTRRRSCARATRSATSSARAPRWPATAPRWSRSRSAARRSSTTATTCAPRPARAASSTPSTTRASSRPTSGRCSARAPGPFRLAALSGEPDDIAAADAALAELFPENARLQRWLRLARRAIAFQGLPARICWLGFGERHRAGLRFNELVRSGEVAAPIVIGRDHLDSGSVASPYRETEGMQDGSDAIADWPILNALLNVASGAAWVAVHHGGGVGIGRSIHAGAQVVADGTDEGARRARARAHERPGHGRDAPRRRGLRDRARDRARARPRPADAA